jgi:hypothetical protein
LKRPVFAAARRGSGPLWLRVFGIPILLGVLSSVGVLAALLGDGVWDALSWLALGVPCVVIAWYWCGAGRLFGRRKTRGPRDTA